MIIWNQTRGVILADSCDIADSFLKRFLGLMPKTSLSLGSGLLITPCNSIHMFFMKFPIDAVFIDKDYNIIYMIENFMPWKCSKIIKHAHSVLELPAGTINRTMTSVGDKLRRE
ncbi:MAG: DUF192 domain-containing protein [Clostridiaceae bacterium]|nr:DUF192 domain-containing protein [Clostridiaceae bacterium]